MPHLTYLPGDRQVPGYPATDLDVDDETATYLLAATHSDGTPLYAGAGPATAAALHIVDEGPEARLALQARNAAWIAEAQAADAAYAASHGVPPEPVEAVAPEATLTPEPAPEPMPEPEPAPEPEAVNISATDGGAATSPLS
jgi:hypothetical protein